MEFIKAQLKDAIEVMEARNDEAAPVVPAGADLPAAPAPQVAVYKGVVTLAEEAIAEISDALNQSRDATTSWRKATYEADADEAGPLEMEYKTILGTRHCT